MKKIIVVGAGPAGLMAAIRASQLGCRVTLIEKNASAGRKLLLSGKGRCNLTNACTLDCFLERFSHGQFLRDAFRTFFNKQLMAFFEERGLKLKVERQERVFPQSDRSAAVLEVLLKELKGKADFFFKTGLKDVVAEGGRVKGVRLGDGRELEADAVILATGGVSYAFTGSTGEGLKIAGKLGHTVVPSKPGLVPLLVKKDFPLPEGLALKNIRLTFISGKKDLETDIGEMLFTADGISGPLVLSWSGQVLDLLAKGPVQASVDLKPGLTEEQIDSRMLKDFKLNPKKNLGNLLKEYLPNRMIDVFIRRSGVPCERKANQVSQAERKKLVSLFKDFRMDITGSLPIEEAMVTRGGVSLKEIDPRTMGSRLVKGLYFCGEMIDVDADTGGFNLQAAFSTGYLAGQSACTFPTS
ncbi:MAG: NAD(P)/FAD-dependent oxidoreductase [Deltaproteobacteria bacterium]